MTFWQWIRWRLGIEDPPPKPPKPPKAKTRDYRFLVSILWFGVHSERTIEYLKRCMRKLDELRAGYGRFDVHLAYLHPAPGIYKWDLLDAFFKYLPKDVRAFLTIYPNAPHMMKYGDKLERLREVIIAEDPKYKNVDLVNNPPSCRPRDLVYFQNLIEEMVERYPGRIHIVQFGSEVWGAKKRVDDLPDFNRWWMGDWVDYYETFVAGRNVIKEFDEAIRICPAGFSFSFWGGGFPEMLHRFLQHVGLTIEKLDLFDGHIYGDHEKDPVKLDALRVLLEKYFCLCPIVVAESGVPDMISPSLAYLEGQPWTPEEEELQERLLANKITTALRHDVHIYGYLTLTLPWARNPDDRWDKMAICEGEKSLKAFIWWQRFIAKALK